MQVIRFPKGFLRFDRRLNLTWLHLSCNSSTETATPHEDIINLNTLVTRKHLTPELKLRLITPDCQLWHAKSADCQFAHDPFWAFYWPGGEALGRYILDNKNIFAKKNVLDIGSGSGACALAAAKSNANFVLANDIDPVSISAIHINARLNNVKVYTNSDNLIGKDVDSFVLNLKSEEVRLKWNIVLVGDMFYDSEFSTELFRWLIELVRNGKMVLVGDPGRHALKHLDAAKDLGTLVKIAEYALINKEHNGFSHGSVFTVTCSRPANPIRVSLF